MFLRARDSGLEIARRDDKTLTGTSAFLKERLFGLSNPQGNHGESIKEAHFHLDNTPVSDRPPLSKDDD